MEILSIRPESSAGNTVARFDVRLDETITLFNLKLVQGRAGLRVYAPSAYGTNTATFAIKLAKQLALAATAALGEKPDHDRSAA